MSSLLHKNVKLTVTSKIAIQALFKNSIPCLQVSGLRILAAPTDKQGKILFIIPAKSGNAVHRNLFKRRVKSLFRENKLYLLSYDFVIIVYKKGLELPFSTLEKLFLSLKTISFS